MEPANHKIFPRFIDESDRLEVISFVDSINEKIVLTDHHLKHLISGINGASYMYDIGKTQLTEEITKYQSGGTVMQGKLSPVFYRLLEKISSEVGISQENSFLQIVDMHNGGKIGRHYDAAALGHVNYKCNISILSEDYEFIVDSQTIQVHQADMYCFEASLYKHWTPFPFNARRILLSFGFMLPYSALQRSESDPRVRLSQRIKKYFQKP